MTIRNRSRDHASAAVACAAAISALASTAWADDAPYLQLEGGASFLSQWASAELAPSNASYGVGAGYHWDTVELGLGVEHNYWLDGVSIDPGFPDSVLNIAAEGALLSFRQRVRHAVALGTSTMLFDTALEDRGHTGLYLEAKPVGLRIPLAQGWRIEVEPLNVALMAPVLDGIPLFQLAYRTTVGVGWEL